MSCKVITVFSNKGGVGKTFVSVNLATVLSLAGYKVLLVDLNFNGGQDMARMLNIAPRQGLVNFITEVGETAAPDIITKYINRHTSGVDFLPAVLQPKQIGQITPENIRPFFKFVTSIYDFVIIDGGTAFHETLITVLDSSNLILLVATPDILSVYQIRWGLEVLQNLHFPLQMVKLVLNRAESRGGVAWQEVRTALPCDIFARIPSDGKAVGMALNRGIPCVVDSPRGKVAEAFNKMAAALLKEDMYIQATDTAKVRTLQEDVSKPSQFWEKFGITRQVPVPDEEYTQSREGDEIIQLKKKIHEKLIQRMDLKDVAPEALSDPQKAQRIKKKAEQVISDLMIETAGAIISSHEKRKDIVNEIINEALGLGPLEELLADADITDIMVNSKDEVYIEKHGKLILTNKTFVSENQMRAIIDRIVAPLGRRIDESSPMVDARLPDGSRINAVIRPLSLNGPMITIRKFSQERYTIDDLLNRFKSLNKPMGDFLNACVLGRKNMIISGGTGAGKTTLLNIVSLFIPQGERIITIEDAAELRLKQKSHWGRLEARTANVEGKGAITIRELFINSLRMRPDRIIIGECRGAEVLDMLQAMNTGHDGSLTTVHANSTRDALVRLSSMMLLSGVDLPIRAMYEMIASAIHVIIQVSRFSDGSRKITGITEVIGLMKDNNQLELKDIFVFEQEGMDKNGTVFGKFKPTGYIPKCYEELATRGIPIDKGIFSAQEHKA